MITLTQHIHSALRFTTADPLHSLRIVAVISRSQAEQESWVIQAWARLASMPLAKQTKQTRKWLEYVRIPCCLTLTLLLLSTSFMSLVKVRFGGCGASWHLLRQPFFPTVFLDVSCPCLQLCSRHGHAMLACG